ncbi:MAG TPA: metal-dependent transcriptional regulator [Thermodesulfobium narugense]|uniref:Transcriptional regulator MntR n=1 Tax=Thermodesulfobium acidiphilum TaxID=1794699 RepID=A0A2R4W2P8_THEAF|nr:metal-dependent transcriptional regulator [Thermodesulfobium acidiphilum]AWB11034.1 iron (metal) dependent repressor, DtxR family [Thermodesulfobium acidiphilum]HEM56207.1 metal-dependent transcriptional regulator [Thermodesulfobium narugense]
MEKPCLEKDFISDSYSELTPSLENYLRTIYDINQSKGIARVRDLAKQLRVKTPSAVAAIESLKNKGLVTQERYGHIELTNKGRILAQNLSRRKNTIVNFLVRILRIEKNLAEQDACLLEHDFSQSTFRKMEKMIAFIEMLEEKHPEIFKEFKKFIFDSDEKYEANEPKSLVELKDDEEAIIVHINLDQISKEKLAILGLKKGSKIKRIQSYKDIINFQIEDSFIALSLNECKHIYCKTV